jgi:hypothetical protein
VRPVRDSTVKLLLALVETGYDVVLPHVSKLNEMLLDSSWGERSPLAPLLIGVIQALSVAEQLKISTFMI